MAEILATATLPATLGEWVQGWIGGKELLVSLVVAWHGSVELCVLQKGDRFHVAGEKATRAFTSAKQIFSGESLRSIPNDCFLNILNPHPPARGLATSTMDIAGTYASVAAYAGEELSEDRLFYLCAGIEASDGIMFKGLALVDHIKGELVERLPSPPEMTIVAIIPSRTLDTADYRGDQATLDAARACFHEHERAYDTLKTGLLRKDPALVAMAATISAEASQSVMPRDEWETLRETCALTGALGIAVAHSGTAAGLLYSTDNRFGADFAERIFKDSFAGSRDYVTVRRTNVSGGGFFAECL
jgi:L-threonine kinase